MACSSEFYSLFLNKKYDSIIRLFESSQLPFAETQVPRSTFFLGASYFMVSRFSDAIPHLLNSFDDQYAYHSACSMVAKAYYKLGTHDLSIQYLYELVSYRKSFENTLLAAKICFNANKLSDAYYFVNIAFSLNPDKASRILLFKIYESFNLSFLAIQLIESTALFHQSTQLYSFLARFCFSQRQFAESINYALLFLDIQDDPDVHLLLASALFKSKKYLEAIHHYRQLLDTPVHSSACMGIADSYVHLKSYSKAINLYLKFVSNELNPSSSSLAIYKKLASTFTLCGDLSQASKYWNKFYQNRSSFRDFKPVNINSSSSSFQACSLPSDQLISYFKDAGYTFVPSHSAPHHLIPLSYRNIFYLHIPKCGGTSFHVPIDLARNCYLASTDTASSFNCVADSYSVDANIESPPASISQLSYLASGIKTFDGIAKPSFFWTIHGELHKQSYLDISDALGFSPFTVVTVRDPVKRLKSQLRYHCPKFSKPHELYNYIVDYGDQISNRYHRLISMRGLTDDLFSKYEFLDVCENPSDSFIHYIPYDDSVCLDAIKSLHLSSSNMPNILQVSYLNRSDYSSPRSSLYTSWIDDALIKCTELGYLKIDQSFDLFSERAVERNKVFIDDYHKISSFGLHPLTIIVTSETKSFIVDTHSLFMNPAKYIS